MEIVVITVFISLHKNVLKYYPDKLWTVIRFDKPTDSLRITECVHVGLL